MKITFTLFVQLITFSLLIIHSNALAEPLSGYEFLSQQAKEMQNDDFQNPGYELIQQGLRIYHQKGENDQSCSHCHGPNGKDLLPKSLAQYPKYIDALEKPLTLNGQIQQCWNNQLDNFPMLYDDPVLLALETYVRNKAIGEKINVDISGNMQPFFNAGKKIYQTRYGQMDMSCAQCHDIYVGKMLRGQLLSQGQTNGFPEFRLESQKMVNLAQRLRECFRSLRATAFEPDSEEFRDLEIYLNARGNGLKIETPAVRY